MAEPYTLTAADVDGCREILAELKEVEAKLGSFRVDGLFVDQVLRPEETDDDEETTDA